MIFIIAYFIGVALLCLFVGFMGYNRGDEYVLIMAWPVMCLAVVLPAPFMGLVWLGKQLRKVPYKELWLEFRAIKNMPRNPPPL